MNNPQPAADPVPVSVSAGTQAAGPGASHSPSKAELEAEAARRRRLSDGAKARVLPDCCNLGIALRILVPLNVAALVLAAGQSLGLLDAVNRFIDIALVLEPVALGSLVVLCAVRKRVNGFRVPLQWAFGVGIPAALAVPAGMVAFPLVAGTTYPGGAGYWVAMRVLATAAVAFVVIEVLRLRARAYSPSLSEARLQALQARIRPHFLFNSLNTVLGLMRGDPRRAERTLENLADLFRVFMRDTRELVPLDEEVVTCQQYLAIEQLRLGDRLSVRWDLDTMPGDALLPSLLLQPLVENSVHHGIEPSTEPGEIAIRITQVGDRVRVEVVNPLAKETPVRPGNQMALSNVRERLMLLYDMEAELRTAEEGGQFRLFLEFPYRKERRRRDVRRHFNPDR
jgi:two-component system sensor histidine kinase AlgZ